MRVQRIGHSFITLVFVCSAWGAPPELKIVPFEGAHRMFNRPVTGKGANDPVLLHVTLKPADEGAAHFEVKLSAEDIFGKPVAWKQELPIDVPAGGKPVERYIPFAAGMGYFMVHAEAGTATASTDFGVVPPPWPGPRPDSLFASNTSGLKNGEDLALLQAIGMKVERVHFQARLDVKGEHWGKDLPPGQAPPIDFSGQDKLWAETRARGLWALPVVGYGLAGDLTDMAVKLGMYGPPADYTRFVNTYLEILNHYPEITAVEFWNEPWIYGWNFAGTPDDYRRLQKQFCEALLKQHPSHRILAGNSTMFVTDNIEPDPASWKGLLSGITHHPYTSSTGAATYRSGDHLRSIDETALIARRMKLPYAYLTEGGTQWAPMFDPMCQAMQNRVKLFEAELAASKDAAEKARIEAALESARAEIARLPAPADDIYDARKVVQYYLKAALAGLFQGNAQWEIGYGPKWTKANTTFAVMTHFIEDRPPLADIWPENELINGVIFASPKFVRDEIKDLPRSRELSARWGVAIPNDRADDKTKVAVIWCQTGRSNDSVDTEGTLTIAKPAGLTAYDMTGRVIKPGPKGLVVPFTEAPVYITTDSLGVMELRERVGNGRIENVTAVNLYALSLSDDASKAQELSVRVENQLNRAVQGTLHLKIDNVNQETSAPFSIDAGKLAEVKVPWPGVPPVQSNHAVPGNQYGITLKAKIAPPQILAPAPGPKKPAQPAPPIVVERRQIASVARFIKRTIRGEEDLAGMTPVVIDSQMLQGGVDLSRYLLNPDLDMHTTGPAGSRVVALVYTAYDDRNIYLDVVVEEEEFKTKAGEPTIKGRRTDKVTLPYKNGMPGGLGYVTYTGDVFQFSFGFRDRVPGIGRQMNDPWAWKGDFYDADYSYVAHPSSDGDQLLRIWGDGSERRNGYQTEQVPGLGPVAGAQIKITRNDKKITFYQITLPRSELKLFDPAAGRCRFGFILYNSEPVASNGLNWSDAAGVFDHWRSNGSFPPTWMQRTACQTYFGIDK